MSHYSVFESAHVLLGVQVMGMSPDPGFAPAAVSRFAPAHVPAFRQQVWTPHGQMINNA